jgi:ribonucleoside-diphosphate reductase alpha chain
MIKQIKKRSGEIVRFKAEKIQNAIAKAMAALGENTKKSKIYTKETIILLESKRLKIPSVEEIQNSVEQVLERNDQRLFKIYSLYRRSRHHAREIKKYFKIKDDLKLSVNALKVLEERYLLKDSRGKIIETPTEMFRRVAKVIGSSKKEKEQFFNAMKNLEFLPNSPTLMNAGTKLGQLSACFVLPIKDSLESIFRTLDDMAIIQQSGGGTGFSFSRIRPKGDIVKSTKGVASGPVSFMRIYDATTETIKQGGKRRGANMGILRIDHPDIVEFINAKQNKKLSNFNISVAATDEFLKKAMKNEHFNLINPRNHEVTGKLNAKEVFDLIIRNAWQSGDPGMIFIDEINRKNPLKEKIEATNPCGEVPLLPYESCNLGSINLSKIIENQKNAKAFLGCSKINRSGNFRHQKINWNKLRELTHLGVEFLNKVIDKNKFPLPEIEKMTKKNRKIGLGVMGFADMLLLMKIPYGSSQSFRLADKIMSFIKKEAGKKAKNNVTLTTIAPTGTISIIAGCSSGIEPLFALAFFREVLEGKKLAEINPIFQTELIKRNLWKEKTIKEIMKTGSLKHTKLPADIKKIFVTSLDISPEMHVKMQAAFQKHVDNAVSKTVNLPENASKQEVKKVYLLAWKLKCKGITVYRYGSKKKQVLYKGTRGLIAKPQFSQSCPTGTCQL